MRPEHSLCHAARLEQAEAQQHGITHDCPNRAGYVGGDCNRLNEDRIDAHDNHNQKRLEAQRQQGF